MIGARYLLFANALSVPSGVTRGKFAHYNTFSRAKRIDS